MGKFAELCDLLPADVNWGDNITPDIVEQIVLAEREACAKVCDEQAEKDRKHQDAGNQPDDYRTGYIDGSGDCGHAIRARSNAELTGVPPTDATKEQ